VGGFVPEDKFFLLLAQKVFPCTDFIRHPSELPYTPAPDMFHDLMGHLPLINIEEFAVFFHNYGLAGQNAKNPQDIVELGRIYWHTVEFGLINPSAFKGPHRDPSCTQVYGAGIASSVGEIPHALSPQVPKYPFDIEKVAQTAYDIHEMQAHYFEIESFSQLQKDFYTWASQKGLL
jgi:phenylalanine-4-hydroxylase